MHDIVGGHLVVAIGSGRHAALMELVSIHLLHLDALRLLVIHVLVVLHRKMIVLRMVLRSATIVALRVSLARMRRFLLDEDAFERGAGAPVSYHHLLRLVHHLRVVDAV